MKKLLLLIFLICIVTACSVDSENKNEQKSIIDEVPENDVRSEHALIPDEDSIAEAKSYLQEDQSAWLRLEPSTIISEKVLSQWSDEEYQLKDVINID